MMVLVATSMLIPTTPRSEMMEMTASIRSSSFATLLEISDASARVVVMWIGSFNLRISTTACIAGSILSLVISFTSRCSPLSTKTRTEIFASAIANARPVAMLPCEYGSEISRARSSADKTLSIEPPVPPCGIVKARTPISCRSQRHH